MTTVASLASATVTAPAAQAADPQAWTCDSDGYLFQSPNGLSAPHDVWKVDIVSGESSEAVSGATTAEYVNAVGYNTVDDFIYGWAGGAAGQLVRVNADLTLTALGVPVGLPQVSYNTGDFDDSGHLWITYNGTAGSNAWAEIDLSDPSSESYGQIITQGTFASSDPIPADWSWIGGKLYGTQGIGSEPHLVVFDPNDAAAGFTDLGGLTGANAWTGSAGATYTDGRYLYASENSTGDIYRVDVTDRATILITDEGPESSNNDGARCSTAQIPTITVSKTVDGRVDAADQFTVGLQDADGDVLTSATTTGSDTTASTTNWPVSQGATYTITDAMAAGSASPLASYDVTISCSNSAGAVATGGDAGAWTLEVTAADDYTCTVTNTSTAGAAWQCTAYGYLFQSPGDGSHTITRVDLVSGATSSAGTTPENVNAVAYNTLDDYMYGWSITSSQLIRINADGSLTGLGLPDGMVTSNWNVGGFDGTGQLWMMDSNLSISPWVHIDLAPGSPTYGTVIASGTTTRPAGLSSTSDWAFTHGSFYGVAAALDTTGPAHLTRFDSVSGQLVDEGPLPGVPSATSEGNAGYGAAYVDAGGYLYVSNNRTGSIYRVNVTTNGAILVTADGPPSSNNDGARCADAQIPTISVAKTVAGRTAATDQFTVGLQNAGGDVLTSATTTGTDTTVSTTDWPVSQGGIYTITDAMAAGSTSPLSGYDATISCSNSAGTVTTGGTAGAWTLEVTAADDYTCTVTNTPVGAPPVFQCPANAPGMLFQHIAPATPPTDMNTIDMVTGAASPTPVFTVAGRAINAVGYNVVDNFVYGWDRANNRVVRVGSDGSAQDLGELAGFGSYLAPIIGDVDDQGHYWIVSQLTGGDADKHWFEIDLNPGPTFMTILDQGDVTWTASADWAYLPGTNALYTVGHDGDDVHLYRFGRTNHTLTDLGSLGASGAGITNPGAMYADPDGHLYTSNNTGGLIYRVDVNAVSADRFAQGPESSGNDGARCASSPIAIDFGDAPDGYGTTLTTDGARHEIADYDETTHTAPLMLGAHIEAEADGQPTTGADGDDAVGVDDEDGVADPIVIQSGFATSVTVSATNSTADAALLAGWIDFDGNGTFDPTEIATVTVPANSSTAEYTLSWSGRTATDINTYARFRLFGGTVATPSPTGSWPSGEVEDYVVQTRALTIDKTSDATSATRIGDTVTYTVTATNTGQGDFTADNPAIVVDDLTGVLDDGSFDGTVTVTGSTIQATYNEPQIRWEGPLAGGATVTLEYSVVLGSGGDQDVVNVAFQTECTVDADCPPPDPQTCADTGVDPATGLPCDTVEVLLPKLTVVKSSPDLVTARIGDTVHYSITATNTGKADYIDPDFAEMVDDLSGLLDDADYDNNAIITVGGGTVSYAGPQITWTGPLAVGDMVTIEYSVTLTGGGDLAVENVVFETPLCTGVDCDPPTPPDPDDCLANDNIDPATGLSCDGITGGLPKLELTKTSPDLATAHIGDTVTFTITATNIGERDFGVDDPAAVIDDLTGVLDDATFDGTVTVDGSDIAASYTEPRITWSGPLAMGDTVTLTYSVVLTGAGDLSVANVAFVPPCTGDGCPVPPTPTPEDCSSNNNVDPLTGLACVPLVEKLPKLELTKTSPDLATAHIGDTVTFTVAATNVGERDFGAGDPAAVIDDLTGVLDDATFDGVITVNGSDIAASYTEPRITWSGPLAMGDTVTLTYSVVLTGAGDLSVANVAFVPPCTGDDCPVPPTPTPEDCSSNGNVDPVTGLPCVPVVQKLPKLELTKSAPDLATARIGDTVTYTVTATNVGKRDFGLVDPAELIDDLTGVLDDATFDGTVTVDGSDIAASYTEPRITWSGPLAVGDTVTLTYSVVLTGAGDLSVANVAFVPPCTGDDCPLPPTPDPEDCASNGNVDPATGLPCVPVVQRLPKLELTKTSPNLATASIGDTVTFTVTATNIGERDFGVDDPAAVIDDLTGVLDDATFDGVVTVDGSDIAASYAEPRISWSGPLAVGDTVTLTYSVLVTGNGDLTVANVAFVPPCTGDDCPVPPTPTPEDCASNNNVDPVTGLACVPLVQDLRELHITKSSDAAGIVKVGDTVTYTVTAKNIGPGDYTADVPAIVVDDLTGVLDDGSYNGDASATVDGALSYSEPQISWSGALASGDSVTISYTVTVTGDGDLDMLNVAFSPLPLDGDCVGEGTCPVPTECVDGADLVTGQPCAVADTPLPGLYVTKNVDKTAASAGDRLTFTVTMTNTGNVDFTTGEPAVLTDDLSGVLDDAAYNSDAQADLAGDLSYTDGVLTWSGALTVGQTVTITYSVTVSSSKTGDDRLNNVASIPDGITPHYPGGVCPNGEATCEPPSPQAITVGDINREAPPANNGGGGSLPNTGVAALTMGLVALLLLIGGGLLMVAARRRRQGERG